MPEKGTMIVKPAARFTKVNMDTSKANLHLAVVLATCSLAFCETDLKRILVDAAQKYAWDQRTDIDRTQLAGGFCFSPSDHSQGEQTCQNQPASKQGLGFLAQSCPIEVLLLSRV